MNGVLWIVWAGLLALGLSATRNPYYLALAVLAMTAVWITVDTTRPLGRPAPRWPLLTSGFLCVWSTLVNGLLAHVGDRVLFRLPPWPVIGGPITINALAYGALTGVALGVALTGFALLQAVVDRHELLRLVPPHHRVLALIVAIALNALPAFATAARDAVLAMRVRGSPLGPLGRLRTMLQAVLYRGMDYSLATSEVLELRGFGSTAASTSRERFAPLLALSGTTLVLTGQLLGMQTIALTGLVLASSGVLMIGRTVWPSVRGIHWSPRTRIAALALISAAILLLWSIRDPASDLAYSPYPTLRAPGFTIPAGLVYLALTIPALIGMRGHS